MVYGLVIVEYVDCIVVFEYGIVVEDGVYIEFFVVGGYYLWLWVVYI